MNPLRPHRAHKAYWAFLGHRLSGLTLAVFLPAHFIVLATALDQSRFDEVLVWTDQPLVKVAEWGLMTCLALHLMFGLRLLLIELAPWWASRRDAADRLIAYGLATSLALGAVFLALTL